MENQVLATTERSGMPLYAKVLIAVATGGLSLAAVFGIRAYRKHKAAKSTPVEPEAEVHE